MATIRRLVPPRSLLTSCKLPTCELLTWNVNNFRHRLPLLLAFLDATKPDVVALQELKSPSAQCPRGELDATGYASVFVGGMEESSGHAPAWVELYGV